MGLLKDTTIIVTIARKKLILHMEDNSMAEGDKFSHKTKVKNSTSAAKN